MLETLALIAAAMGFGALFPRVADGCAGVITFGFLVPLMLVGGGVCSYSALNLYAWLTDATWEAPFWACCAFCGGPLALLVIKVIYSK